MQAFLAPGSAEEESLAALLEEPGMGAAGLWVAELDGVPVAALELTMVSSRSRICQLSRLMVRPQRRGAGVGSATVLAACREAFGGHGVHRVQAEVYGDNVAGQRVFQRAGFTREGVRRRAYWRRESWQDGVIYGLLAEEWVDGGGAGAP